MADVAFVSEHSGKKYRVVRWDKDAGTVTLVGEAGIEFEQKFNKELFQKIGYKLVTA